ncbi:hypothetical protein VKT23_004364 [Stygiomarasmius scandens]|uniref:Uncharacterized protein n=1 Tax=Marasmiellus scandens TaxID=2682957 RepID=A0ABR1JTW5_9AGAR
MELWVLKTLLSDEERFRRCQEVLYRASEQLEDLLAEYYVAKMSITRWVHRSDGEDGREHYTIRAYGLTERVAGSIHVGKELEYVQWFDEKQEKERKRGKRGKEQKRGKQVKSEAGAVFDSSKHVFISEAFSSRSCFPLEF